MLFTFHGEKWRYVSHIFAKYLIRFKCNSAFRNVDMIRKMFENCVDVWWLAVAGSQSSLCSDRVSVFGLKSSRYSDYIQYNGEFMREISLFIFSWRAFLPIDKKRKLWMWRHCRQYFDCCIYLNYEFNNPCKCVVNSSYSHNDNLMWYQFRVSR